VRTLRNPFVRLALTGALALVLVIASLVVWLDEGDSAADDPDATTTTHVTRGQTLFFAKGCAGCHRIVGLGGQDMAPDLTLLADRAGGRRDGMSAEEYVRESIQNPSAFSAPGYVGGFSMPTLPMTSAELDALVLFLLQER
jgi:cytochrome c peroxidase